MKLKEGQKIDYFEHKLEIKKIQYILGYPDRVVLSCRPHCCTTPRHIVMELPVDVLETIRNAKIKPKSRDENR